MEKQKQTVKKLKKEKRTSEEKTEYTHRLNRIEGQVKGIQQMILEDRSYEDIVMQTLSVTNAMKGVSASLIEDHMKKKVLPNEDKKIYQEMKDILKWLDRIK